MNRFALGIGAIFLAILAVLAGEFVEGQAFAEWPLALQISVLATMLIGMVLVGMDNLAKRKAQDSWQPSPYKSRWANWVNRRRAKFSPKRGALFFLLGLIVFGIMVLIKLGPEASISVPGAIFFIFGASVTVGIVGTFSDYPTI